MTKSFLTATAFAALLGFGASAALAQQSAPQLEAPKIQKSAPADTGKAASDKSGTVQNKSTAPAQQGATSPADKTKRDAASAKTADGKAKREAAQACANVKDKAAHEACVTNHVKNQSAKTPSGAANQKSAVPDKSKPTPRTGG